MFVTVYLVVTKRFCSKIHGALARMTKGYLSFADHALACSSCAHLRDLNSYLPLALTKRTKMAKNCACGLTLYQTMCSHDWQENFSI